MKKILFAITGFIMALALVVAAPGVAGATATTVTLSGPGSANYSSYSWNAGSLTITEAPLIAGIIPAWILVDVPDNLGVWVTNGVIQITGTGITLSGTLEKLSGFAVEGSFTDVPGTLSAFTNNNGYTWDASFQSLAALSTPIFTVPAGTFTGSLGFSTHGGPSTAVSFSSNLTLVPIPPAVMLFAPGLLCLIGIRKRLKG